jgi:hypothetical protein
MGGQRSGKDTAKGSVYQTFQQWFFSGDPQNYPISLPPSPPTYTFTYDGLGRVKAVSDSTGPVSKHLCHAISQDDYDANDLEANGPHSNTPSNIQHDGHGRIVSFTRQLKTSKGLDKITTQWSYLSTGEVAAQLQTHSLGNEQVSPWMQYDSLGRLILNVEPNTSIVHAVNPCPNPVPRPVQNCKPYLEVKAWHYAYDNAGNLVGTSDARGCGKNLFYAAWGVLSQKIFRPAALITLSMQSQS